MSDELVLWDGVDDNGQYDIYEVSEDDKGLVLKLVSEKDGSSLELFHLKIMSSNSIFDVVSWGEPKVRNCKNKWRGAYEK